jgi:hypothetical protein
MRNDSKKKTFKLKYIEYTKEVFDLDMFQISMSVRVCVCVRGGGGG